MYIPTSFLEKDKGTLLSFMRAHSFATLVSVIDGALFASHIPLAVEERGETIVLTGHVSKANAHVKAFSADNAIPTLAIFTGPHAYVSPAAYEARESVPTWNYIAVHATGVPTAVHSVTDPAAMQEMLEKMIEQYDASYGEQWQELSTKYRDGMMRGIVGFEMPLVRLEGKYKLSQNKHAHDQAAVAAMLEQSDDEQARAVAKEMRLRQIG
ncbi:MAG: FMN-binding negative transcriptional regulator [Gemmatimonadaceae bacterium]